MAGIYLHIPFCKQACTYCDFHFSTSLKTKDDLIDALIQEINLESDFLTDKNIETIYFGGGTPSLLQADEINRIVDALADNYNLDNLTEVTLEANPDDLNATYLQSLQNTIIDRLSIGIQSFQEQDLRMMNRAHNAVEAERSVKIAQDFGFENLSCDLIFGTPNLSLSMLVENIQKLVRWQVPHISAYALTIEERTVLHRQMQQNKFIPSTEAQYEQQMLCTMDTLAAEGYEQYEISNYSLPGKQAIHNTNYWKGVPYLGIGPSAHSFDGRHIRRWNLRNNNLYIKSLAEGQPCFEEETLTLRDRANERIMTQLRTQWGLDLEQFEQDFGAIYSTEFQRNADSFLKEQTLLLQERVYTLSRKGKLVADHVAAHLFV